LARAQILHFKAVGDLVFEELYIGAYDYKVVNVDVNTAEPSGILMNEEAGVDVGWAKVD
jgi:hypothetical protein